MTKVKFKVQGETAKVIVSQVHQSLRMIVKEAGSDRQPRHLAVWHHKTSRANKNSCNDRDLRR